MADLDSFAPVPPLSPALFQELSLLGLVNSYFGFRLASTRDATDETFMPGLMQAMKTFGEACRKTLANLSVLESVPFAVEAERTFASQCRQLFPTILRDSLQAVKQVHTAPTDPALAATLKNTLDQMLSLIIQIFQTSTNAARDVISAKQRELFSKLGAVLVLMKSDGILTDKPELKTALSTAAVEAMALGYSIRSFSLTIPTDRSSQIAIFEATGTLEEMLESLLKTTATEAAKELTQRDLPALSDVTRSILQEVRQIHSGLHAQPQLEPLTDEAIPKTLAQCKAVCDGLLSLLKPQELREFAYLLEILTPLAAAILRLQAIPDLVGFFHIMSSIHSSIERAAQDAKRIAGEFADPVLSNHFLIISEAIEFQGVRLAVASDLYLSFLSGGSSASTLDKYPAIFSLPYALLYCLETMAHFIHTLLSILQAEEEEERN